MTVEDWFGLRREAFSIAPDPAFLYPGEIHREALELLRYGLQRGASFVLLTGAIGAGKTTVWRRFLERLPASVDVASVVNPRLDVTALLARICDDLHVDLPPGGRSVDLIDALHGHLLLAHAQGRRTLIAIDEAQALSPEVLEQLRLLTNLDADGKKLQVLLIGQPELRQTLARPEMEPLSQRVVARYHLPALSAAETGRYIAHRLQVAGLASERMPFDADAVAAVHSACRGVPRRINAVCDRALVLAHAAGTRHIGPAIVDGAVADVQGRAEAAAPADAALSRPTLQTGTTSDADAQGRADAAGPAGETRARAAAPAGAASIAMATATPMSAPGMQPMPLLSARPARQGALPALAFGALVAGALWLGLRDRAAVAPAPVASVAASAPSAASAPTTAAALSPPSAAAAAVASQASASVFTPAAADQSAAWRALAAQWGTTLGAGDACAAAPQQGLRCLQSRGGLAAVRQFDRPALLRLAGDGGRVAHVVLIGVGADSALLAAGGAELTLPLLQLAQLWRGDFTTLWRVPPGYGDASDGGTAAAAWLAGMLGGMDGSRGSRGGPDGPDGVSDQGEQLAQRVAAFQQSQGLVPDGIAGPLTLIQLSRAGGVAEPRLQVLTSGSRRP